MTKESSRTSDEIKEIWKQADRTIERNKVNFEHSRPPCPFGDGTTGKFIEYRGAYTRVRGFFRCKNGHEFYEG